MAEARRKRSPAEDYAASMARRLRRLSPRGATVVLVGPPLVYGEGEDEALCMILVRGDPGGDHRIVNAKLGRLVADAMDFPFAHLFDTVMEIRKPGEITMREARARKAALVAKLAGGGARVEDCTTEEELVDRYGRLFPGERSRALRAAFAAEQVAA